jgi:hypothetical protein
MGCCTMYTSVCTEYKVKKNKVGHVQLENEYAILYAYCILIAKMCDLKKALKFVFMSLFIFYFVSLMKQTCFIFNFHVLDEY